VREKADKGVTEELSRLKRERKRGVEKTAIAKKSSLGGTVSQPLNNWSERCRNLKRVQVGHLRARVVVQGFVREILSRLLSCWPRKLNGGGAAWEHYEEGDRRVGSTGWVWGGLLRRDGIAACDELGGGGDNSGYSKRLTYRGTVSI